MDYLSKLVRSIFFCSISKPRWSIIFCAKSMLNFCQLRIMLPTSFSTVWTMWRPKNFQPTFVNIILLWIFEECLIANWPQICEKKWNYVSWVFLLVSDALRCFLYIFWTIPYAKALGLSITHVSCYSNTYPFIFWIWVLA